MQDRMEQNTEQNRIEQNTEQNRIEYRIEQNRIELHDRIENRNCPYQNNVCKIEYRIEQNCMIEQKIAIALLDLYVHYKIKQELKFYRFI